LNSRPLETRGDAQVLVADVDADGGRRARDASSAPVGVRRAGAGLDDARPLELLPIGHGAYDYGPRIEPSLVGLAASFRALTGP